ncbi:MAG TPA: UDP-N-acetylmuramate dehydrogenase [Actinomycetota bacterium]
MSSATERWGAMGDAIDAAAATMEARAHGSVKRDAPIGPLTSYRIGGPAGVYLEAAGDEDLAALAAAVRETSVPVLIVGRGSNMLVSDHGFPGIVVRLGGGFRWARVEDAAIVAGAAMPLPALASLAMDHGLTGFEFGAAIPGSLGGGVRMNAGAHGREIRDVLVSADLYLMSEMRVSTLPVAEAGFAYRTSRLPSDAIVITARLGLTPGSRDEIEREMREVREWRRANQPLSLPNGGSVFKNPPGDSAGRLVEQVCGKGARVGAARISEVHANFIVTEPAATANEVYTLIRWIQRRVREQTGVELEPELKMIGDFEEVPDGRDAG